ncbi:MAG: HEPN domain-containing protein [Trueperaceae bacterium]
MSFDWARLIDVAESMRNHAGTVAESDPGLAEAAWRAAVSRAYYGAFNRTRVAHRGYWGRDPIEADGLGVHAELLRSLEQKAPHVGHPDVQHAVDKLALDLRRLRDLRTRADYDDQFEDAARTADRALRLAKKIRDATLILVRP